MTRRLQQVVRSADDELRHEPAGRRVRAAVNGVAVLDTVRASVVWEPRRILCEYAVPEVDLRAELRPSEQEPQSPPSAEESPRIMPWVPFAAHSAQGEVLDVVLGDQTLTGAAFRLRAAADDDGDAALAATVLLDFAAFDTWWHEDEVNVGHPRDPFHRVDALPSSRAVRVEVDGQVLARSRRPVVLLESEFPPRFYLPVDDVLVDLARTQTRTPCAYKGWASYWTARVGGRELVDLAWGYEDPLHEAERVRGLVCFDDSQPGVVVLTDAAATDES